MSLGAEPLLAVAIVTGGAYPVGRDIARGLAGWAWPVIIVYLDHQPRAETTVADIIAAGGTTVAVRADLADELDVQRLFTESMVAFGRVDVIVHTTTEVADVLCTYALREMPQRAAVVMTTTSRPISSDVAADLRRRAIAVERVSPDVVLPLLQAWNGRRMAEKALGTEADER
jgi:3-oxoacyl-[acyl-carrier protein] reductase